MALDAVTLLQLVVLLTWTCLNTFNGRQKHPLFTKVLSSQVILEELLSSASMVFAPGLLQVLQSSTPPTVSYLKSLPTNFKKLWGIYLLVLEKPGHRPKIYIGSGTDAKSGVSARLATYDSGVLKPMYVGRALQDGYVIVHKGLLCWTSLPSAAMVPVLRVLFLALEATFTGVFQAMRCKTEGPFEYDGLCTHSALSEAPLGDHNLSAEELEAHAAEFIQRRKQYYKEWREKTKNDDADSYHAKKREERRIYLQRHPGAQKETDRRCKEKAVAEKRHYCSICDHAFIKKAKLTKHLAGPRHAAKAARYQQSSSRSST